MMFEPFDHHSFSFQNLKLFIFHENERRILIAVVIHPARTKYYTQVDFQIHTPDIPYTEVRDLNSEII